MTGEMKSRGIVVLGVITLAFGLMLVTPVCGAESAPKPSYFRVMAVMVKNDSAGKTLLTKYQTVLKERKYSDVVIMPNADKSKLCLLVGRFAPNGMIDAESVRQKVAEEPYEGKKPFKDASVVHGM